MKLSGLAVTTLGTLGLSGTAMAGGLFIPGNGVISTSRAGAAVASAEDGEAISINPAGIAKTVGTVVQIGIVAIDYAMSFTRAGTYDPIAEESVSYAGQPYPTITNDAKPPLGFGSFQPVPVIAVVSDLGGMIPHLHAGFGVYAPQGYPFRDMNTVNGKQYFVPDAATGYSFPTFGDPPPPTRYDIIHEEAAVILPSLAIAYSVLPELDIGLRLSAGIANLKSTVAVWGLLNYEEWNKQDGLFTLDAKDNFVPAYGIGATYRPTPELEFGANFDSSIEIHAQGDALSINGPAVSLNGAPVVLLPVPDDAARCATGGTMAKLKGCVDVELPLSVQVGGRYKINDTNGKLKGDIELNLDWEHWGAKCDYAKDPLCLDPSDFRVVVDGQVTTASMPASGVNLKDNLVTHGLQDTYAARLGGSYIVPMDANALVIRGGLSYDTAAARKGWERADLDGAARTTIAAGASYKLPTWSIDAGFGVILEGTRTENRNCNPTAGVGKMGCDGSGTDAPADQRQGPDPINPILVPSVQSENPVNQGTFTSHYIMFMLGASHRF